MVLDDTASIDFEYYICFDNKQETEVFTEGYPEVLNDNNINQRLRLKGKLENTFPLMDKLAIYKLTDSINCYIEYTDKDLLEGLSGGPVYMQRHGEKYLLGINQSVCNVGDGNNPFKIVYFIQMRQVFEWLRSQGIILFEYNYGKICIEWIYQDKDALPDQSIRILLLGGSGAGKSSFIKELLLHSREVNASGDGQTTRMDINYNLMNFCSNPKVYIKILDKKAFSQKMADQTKFNIIEYIFTNFFHFPYIDLKINMAGYAKMILPQLENLMFILNERPYIEKIENILRDIKNVICKDEDAEQKEIEILYENIFNVLSALMKNEQITEGQLSKILYIENFLQYQDNKYKNNIKNFQDNSGNRQGLFNDYIEEVLKEKDTKEAKRISNETNIFDVINICEGFFDIREFYYLEDTLEENVKNIFNGCLYNEIKEDIFSHIKMLKQGNTDSKDNNENIDLKKYYGNLYDIILSSILKYHDIDFKKNKKIEINLDDIVKKEKDFLELCLKVVKGKSLSGIIENIEINDSISNNYAYMFKQKGVGKICFIDTCGLDHIERGIGIKSHINKLFIEYKDNKIVFDAILYVKKLDAGRPSELQRILPLLYNACPGKPVFCLFTGADIFYTGHEELLLEKEWGSHTYAQSKKIDENIIPKSVAYFFENKKLVSGIPCSDEWKEIIYNVIRENLIPFVSDTQIRNRQEYIISNRRYLKKLFEAILLDEWNAGYINTEEIINLMNTTSFKEALNEDISNMFYKASLFNWNYKHHMTINANITRLFGDKSYNSMGYIGVSIDRWDCLLKSGYQEVFLEGKSKVIRVLGEKKIGISQIESMFAKLKDIIIAEDMGVRNIDNNKEESLFRKTFKKMYDEKSGHEYNPFSSGLNNVEYNDQISKKKILSDVCDFTRGLERDDIKNSFFKIFRDEIVYYLDRQNKERMKLLLQHRSDFKEKIYDVLDEIEVVLGEGNDRWILEMIREIIKFRKDN